MAKPFPQKFIKKNVHLAFELTEWMVTHKKNALDRFPHGSEIILTSTADSALSEANRAMALNSQHRKFVEARKTKVGWRFRVLK